MTPHHDIARGRSPEAAALGQFLRVSAGTLSASDAEEGLLGLSVSSSLLRSMMTEHGIGGQSLPDGLLRSVLAGQDIDAIRAQDRAASAWNLLLFREQRLLDEQLSDVGRPYLYVKGLLLGYSLHGDLTTRPTRDIDVMIRPEDLTLFRSRLLAAGYEEVYHFPEAHLRHLLWLNREVVFRRRVEEGVYVYVELQWSPVLAFYGIPFDTGFLFADGIRLPLAGVEWHLPDVEGQLCGLLLHHGVTDGWRTLRHVLDISLFLQCKSGEVDWDEIRERLAAMGMLRNASAGFSLCRSLAGVSVPEGFDVEEGLTRRLEDSLLARRSLPRDQRSLPFVCRQWLLADGSRAKTRFILGQLRKAFSPGLLELEGIPLPAGLFPLYYLFKPLRPLLRPFMGAGAGEGLHD